MYINYILKFICIKELSKEEGNAFQKYECNGFWDFAVLNIYIFLVLLFLFFFLTFWEIKKGFILDSIVEGSTDEKKQVEWRFSATLKTMKMGWPQPWALEQLRMVVTSHHRALAVPEDNRGFSSKNF